MASAGTSLALRKDTTTATAVGASLLSLLLGLALQYLIVSVRYQGHWTALYCTGSAFPVPPALAGEQVYVFPNSTGYDGQMYHYVAHDPLLRTDMWRYVDDARVRFSRILVPGLAWLLAAGRSGAVDFTYLAVNLLFLFLGAWWLGRYLEGEGISPAFGALFLLAPAVLISLDRLCLDLAFTSLCLGFLLYMKRRLYWAAWIVAALACLCRETGVPLTVAAVIVMLMERKVLRAAAFAVAPVPFMAWYAYVASRVPGDSGASFRTLSPFGFLQAIIDPVTYPLAPAVNAVLRGLDLMALAGVLLAFVLAAWFTRRKGPGLLEIAALLWTAVALSLPGQYWRDSYSGPRAFTPLMIFVFLSGLRFSPRLAAAPLLMTVPRVAAQVLAPLLMGLRILR